jgi:hypothetical protein
MVAHGEPGRAPWDAMGVHLRGCSRGPRMVTPARIEGDDGGDGFGLHKLVDAVGIEPTIIDHRPDGEGQCVGRTGLEEAIQAGGCHGKVGDMPGGEVDVHGQGMLRGHDTVLQGAVPEEGGVPGGVIAPGGGRIAIVPLMIAAEEALGATVAGGPPGGTGPGREARPIATQDEGAEVAPQPALG